MQIKFQKASKTLKVLWNETINNTLKFVPAKKTAESLPNKVDAYLNQKVGKTCQEYSVLNESLNTR